MYVHCAYVDDLGACDLPAIGMDQRNILTCERHAFIGGQTLTLFDKEEGLQRLQEQAEAYELFGTF